MRARTLHSTAVLFWTLGLLLAGSLSLAPRDAEARVERFVRVKVHVANLRTGQVPASTFSALSMEPETCTFQPCGGVRWTGGT
jgi:hypothetical protein